MNDAPRSVGEVAALAQLYFDLIYRGDLALFDRVFSPRAQLAALEEGAVTVRSAQEYLAMLAGRPSPESSGAPREEEVIAIDLASHTQAFLKVRVRINQAVFVDYLTLLRGEDGWRIVSKTYHRLDTAQT
jgi:hypothetical protein